MTWLHRDIDVSHFGNELKIVRHPSRGFFAIARAIVLAVWLVAWGVAEYNVGRLVVLGLPYKSLPNARLDPFTWIWFIFWSLGGFIAAAALYAAVRAGPEVVTIKDGEIVTSSQIRPWMRTNRWYVDNISAMHLRRLGTRQRSCLIQFAYKGKKQALLAPSDLESTRRILNEIRNHFSSRKHEHVFSDESEDQY